MKKFYLFVFILFATSAFCFADQIDNVADLIRQGNIHELSKLFAPNVQTSILDDENVYPKAQAETVLSKFFSQNRPQSVKLLHKINSNPTYRFGVIIASTDKGAFRIAYTLKETNGNFMLIEMRIETEKVK